MAWWAHQHHHGQRRHHVERHSFGCEQTSCTPISATSTPASGWPTWLSPPRPTRDGDLPRAWTAQTIAADKASGSATLGDGHGLAIRDDQARPNLLSMNSQHFCRPYFCWLAAPAASSGAVASSAPARAVGTGIDSCPPDCAATMASAF